MVMSKNLKYFILIGLGSFIILSCNNSVLKDDYTNWIEDQDNGLLKTKEISDFNYVIQYKPVEYILEKKQKDSLLKSDFDNLHYIDLELSHKKFPEYLKIDLQNNEEYYHRLKYYSFEIQNDVNLIDGKDTLKCVFSHFERTYGITPYVKIVMAFEKQNETSSHLIFSYHDQIFDNGIINIPINEKALKEASKIKI